uniref:FHA domain-containing protein n=1 Tax=Steinernema glaseri TaxID=37863 RepID=A0A1I7Z6A9_9BILA
MSTPVRPARGQHANNGNRDEAHGLELRAAQEVRSRAESEYYHQLIGIEGTPAIVEEKRDPGSGGRGEVALQTNVYGLALKPTQIYRYDVKVHAQLGRSDRSIELTKRSADDTTALERKTKCRLCLDLVVTKHPEVFNQRRELIWYDNQGILFAAQQLNIAANEKKQFILEGNELATMDVFAGVGRISFQVTPCANSFVINTGEVGRYITPNLDDMDHSLQQFLELLTSQYALNTPEEARRSRLLWSRNSVPHPATEIRLPATRLS